MFVNMQLAKKEIVGGVARLLSHCIIFQGYHIWISTIHAMYWDNYKYFY
jgi:hypothetical protein